MVLPVSGLALSADNRAADPHRGIRAAEIEVAQADRQHFPDPDRGAQQHFDDLAELPVRSRPGLDRPLLPRLNRIPD